MKRTISVIILAAIAAVSSVSIASSAAPDGGKDVIDVAVGSKDHKTLVTAVTSAELVTSLKNPGPFTVFAPTDAAFAKLPAGTVDNLLKPENKESLRNILQYHVALGVFGEKLLTDGQIIGEANGDSVTIAMKNGKPTVNGAAIVASVPATNGIVHVIDTVLLPPEQK